MKRAFLPLILGLSLAAPAIAGPLADFDAAYRGMYARYRAALFQTNAGSPETATQAMKGFAAAWGQFAAIYGTTPPVHLAEDAGWPATVQDVTAALSAAQAEVLAGQLPEAHETLEHVRDVLSDMHARNGIESYSDRMNAYHAQMEGVLSFDLSQPDALALLREKAAVLAYLSGDLLASPPPEAAGSAEYDTLSAEFAASVAALMDAARSGDMATVKSALAGLKKPYAKLFVKFG